MGKDIDIIISFLFILIFQTPFAIYFVLPNADIEPTPVQGMAMARLYTALWVPPNNRGRLVCLYLEFKYYMERKCFKTDPQCAFYNVYSRLSLCHGLNIFALYIDIH